MMVSLFAFRVVLHIVATVGLCFIFLCLTTYLRYGDVGILHLSVLSTVNLWLVGRLDNSVKEDISKVGTIL